MRSHEKKIIFLATLCLFSCPVALAESPQKGDEWSNRGTPLRVIIRPRERQKTPAELYQETSENVENYIATHDWSVTLDNRFFSGHEDRQFIENYTTETSEDRFHGLNKTLSTHGDKTLALAKVEFKGHRLYNQVSRNIINPLYTLQTGPGTYNPDFTTHARAGQDWLVMNMQSIGTYAEKGTRRPIARMLTTAPKYFNFNASLKKSQNIMQENAARKSTIQPLTTE